MAIGYLEKRIVSIGRGESLVGLQRYVCRQDGEDPVTGRWYHFAKDSADLHSYDVLLPLCAPYEFQDPTRLCAAAERRETTLDRKTGRPRFKKNAQVGIHIVLALPKELSPQENRRLACAWARSQYVNYGVGAIVAVHYPDHPAKGNAHAHIIVTTRVITPTGLGRKARHLNPRFSRGEGQTWSKLHGENLPAQWAHFQDEWFRKNGIELRVDPFQASPGVHHSGGRTQAGKDAKAADLAAEEEARRLLQDPAQILIELTRRRAMFSRRDIAALLRRHGFLKEDIDRLTKLALSHRDLVRLHDPETGEPLKLFTTRQVREQEALILNAAGVLMLCKPDARRRRKVAAAAEERIKAMGLAPEQARALRYLIDGPNLRILRGIAGAGKSYTIRAVRESLEAGGLRVIGLAPTNTVACAMAVDGFSEAATVDLELIRQESDCQRSAPWDQNTCIIIDEAAMLDAPRYQRILVRAAAAGTRVILVGDEKQLASVERGGIFDVLKQRHGCTELLDVRRQTAAWAKAASQDFAAGRIRAGIKAYEEHGCLHSSADVDAARAALVARWGEDVRREPDGSRFVYASTNAVVNQLNRDLQNERWRGQHVAFRTFDTCRGTIDLVEGDRIQLHGNDRKLGLFNGLVGTVRFVAEDRITFVPDGGRELSFDPRTFQDWALGYAGTTYRGQGKTQAHVYALYDHKLAWHARTSYVGFTRHKESMAMFVPRSLAADTDTLIRQMERADQTQASILLLDEQEAEELRKTRKSVQPVPADVPAAPVASEIVATPPARPWKPAGKHSPTPTGIPTPASIVLSSEIVPAITGPSSGAGGGVGRGSRAMTALPYRTRLAGQDRSFDLSLPEDEVDLLDALSKEPMKRVVEIYGDLQRAAATADSGAAGHLRGLLGRVTMQSQNRAFLPREDRIYAECLHYTRLDPRNIIHHDALRRRKGEVDIAPMVQPLYDVQQDVRRNLGAKLKGFVIEALRTIDISLGNASIRAKDDEELQFAIINTRSWFYDLIYDLGLDLHPEVTRELGRRATPEEYRDQYLTLARKAEKAAGLEPQPPAPESQSQTVILQRVYPHFDYHKERLLTELYRTRLVAQVAEATKAFDDAMMGRNFAEYCSGGRSTLHRDKEAAAQLRLAALKRKLAAFEADPARTIRAASPLDFLPANVTEREVAGPKVFCAPDVTGFRSPDKAARMLEAILWERLWVRVPKPRQTQPEQQPSQPTPMKQIDRTAGREID